MPNVFIQNDSRGKVNILGRGNMGHFERKKNHMNMWLILRG